jgi:AraC family transcriptional regulator
MGSSRQSASNQRPADAQAIGGVRVGVLGDVVSPRGVRLLATHGPAGELKTYLLPHMATFSYSIRSPNNVALTVDGRPFRTSGPLGFCAAGVPLQLRATGYFTYAICFLSSDFLDGLAETESGLRLGGIDLMYSIESERLTHLSRAAFREAIEPGFSSAVFAETMATAITLELARYYGSRRLGSAPRGRGLAPWQMRRLDDYIRAHLSENLTLHELAMLLGISVRHLSRAVRQAKGTSVYRWISDYRLLEARRLLGETDLLVSEIARRSAFQSAAAFSSAFRSAVGFTPAEFRHLNVRAPGRR